MLSTAVWRSYAQSLGLDQTFILDSLSFSNSKGKLASQTDGKAPVDDLHDAHVY
jgi:hypothetical protein